MIRKRSYIMSVVVVAVMLISMFLLTACQGDVTNTETQEATPDSTTDTSDTSGETSEAPSSDKIKIAIAINDLDEYQTRVLKYYNEACDKHGYELIYTNAGGSVEKQISDVESLIIQEPDVIGIQALDSAALADIADQIYESGTPVASVFYKIDTENCLDVGGGVPTERGYAYGEVLTTYLEENPEATVNLGYMWGMKSMEGAVVMHNGYLQCLDESGLKDRINVLDEQETNWSADEALDLAEDWMQAFPEMNCIVAQSDQMCVGAVSALTAAGRDLSEWIIIGGDTTIESADLIKDGSMYGSVLTNLQRAGEHIIVTLAEFAQGLHKNGDVCNGQDIYTLVFQDNIDDYLELLK